MTERWWEKHVLQVAIIFAGQDEQQQQQKGTKRSATW